MAILEPEWFHPPVRAFTDFPTTFSRIRDSYQGFRPVFEGHRDSFSEWFGRAMESRPQLSVAGIQDELAEAGPLPSRPIRLLVQRHFYWSAACFFRAYSLFLAYLTLDRCALKTWAQVTGYYSRFYIAKATCNLMLCGWVHLDRPMQGRAKREQYLLYVGSERPRVVPIGDARILDGRSHERWWRLFRQLRLIDGMPASESVKLLFTEWEFTSEERNEANYSDIYLDDFVELEWFDTSIEQMLSHAGFRWARRQDQDFTDIDRYFDGYNPEYAEPADFYTDSIQLLWHSILAYLDCLGALDIDQDFITDKKLVTLAQEIIGADYPVVTEGIRRALADRRSFE